MTDDNIVISIEGNIGVGKSTFTQKFQELNLNDIHFISEPVNIWLNLKDNNNNNFLDLFYKDKQRWGYTFQNLAYITRMTDVIEKLYTSKKKVIITDRSIGTDKNVFGKMLHDDNYIDDLEWNIYNYWNGFFDKYIKHSETQNVIYLQCSPEVAMERIKKRGRVEEQNIEFDYIKKLSEYHDKWLLETKNVNVLILDCNKEFENDKEVFEQFTNKTINFINSLKI
jgi:deoxyadenosine/deoxycytidine kinase